MGLPKSCIGCLICVPLLAFIIGMSLSYRTLGPLEAGVKINTLTQGISDTFFIQGRHYIGPLYNFIRFPTTLQSIEFSHDPNADGKPLRVSSQRGQIMTLEISFQFRLMSSKLSLLYKAYEKKFKTKYTSIAETEIKNHAPRYTTNQFFTNRIQIAQAMHNALNTKFKSEFFAVIEHFQLRNIQPPTTISVNIRDKLIQKEKGLLANEKKQAIAVRATSKTIQAEYESLAKIVNAQAEKEATLTTEQAIAEGVAIRLERKAQAYLRLKNALGFNNTDLLKFLYIENIRNAKSPDKIISNLDSAFFSTQL